jgi:hypothetical protein
MATIVLLPSMVNLPRPPETMVYDSSSLMPSSLSVAETLTTYNKMYSHKPGWMTK